MIVSLPPLKECDKTKRLSLSSKILLARLANDCIVSERSSTSQRYLAMVFNKSSRKTTAHWLTELRNSGLIRLDSYSVGLKPNSYALTEQLLNDPETWSVVEGLAHALYGPNGLLVDWPFPATWGHGALNASGTLILATLLKANQSMDHDFLNRYLRPLMHRSTIKRSVAKLAELNIVHADQKSLCLQLGWQYHLIEFLNSCNAGNARLDWGNEQRNREWRANAHRINDGCLTEAEVMFLRRLPCVYCQESSSEQEHFPPRRFLDHHQIPEDRLHIWAVCQECNNSRSEFIKQLPFRKLARPREWHFDTEEDFMIALAVNANFHLERFNRAYRSGDIQAAVNAIYFTMNITLIAQEMRVDLVPPSAPPDHLRSRQRYTRWTAADSQLRSPYVFIQ